MPELGEARSITCENILYENSDRIVRCLPRFVCKKLVVEGKSNKVQVAINRQSSEAQLDQCRALQGFLSPTSIYALYK